MNRAFGYVIALAALAGPALAVPNAEKTAAAAFPVNPGCKSSVAAVQESPASGFSTQYFYTSVDALTEKSGSHDGRPDKPQFAAL